MSSPFATSGSVMVDWIDTGFVFVDVLAVTLFSIIRSISFMETPLPEVVENILKIL